MVKNEVTERAKELQREYLRNWRRKNPDKMKQYSESYWMRKAEKEREAKANDTVSEN